MNQSFAERMGMDEGVYMEITLTIPGVLVLRGNQMSVGDAASINTKRNKYKFPKS